MDRWRVPTRMQPVGCLIFLLAPLSRHFLCSCNACNRNDNKSELEWTGVAGGRECTELAKGWNDTYQQGRQ